jgi:hypothetical protein
MEGPELGIVTCLSFSTEGEKEPKCELPGQPIYEAC